MTFDPRSHVPCRNDASKPDGSNFGDGRSADSKQDKSEQIRCGSFTLAAVFWAMFVLLTLSPSAFATDYVQAPGSTLAFAGKYDGEMFTGTFPGFTTKFSFDPARLADARLDVTIALVGANTGNDDRDATLQGPDFFNIGKFAQAHYTASTFRSLGGDRYIADGTLELRGIKRPVVLTFTWTPGANTVLAGKATVKRLDFNVGGGDWADTSLIPDAIAISTKVVLQPAP